jgi:hypothetical protein
MDFGPDVIPMEPYGRYAGSSSRRRLDLFEADIRGYFNHIQHEWLQKMVAHRIAEQRAWQAATNGRGPWWNGGAAHMHAAYPKSWFDHTGLVSLLDTQRFSSVS